MKSEDARIFSSLKALPSSFNKVKKHQKASITNRVEAGPKWRIL